MAKRRTERRTEVVSGGKGGESNAERMSRSEQRRREREQQQRRQRLMIIGGVIGAIALLAVVAIIINTLPADAPIAPGAVERYQNVPVSVSERGYPRLGDGRVRVEEYSSFSCPGCLSFHDDGYYDLVERARAGEISFTFVPMGNFGSPGGVDAAKAALCVAEQDQRAFWTFHDTLFLWQSQFARQAFTLNRLRSGVEQLGLNVGQYDSCMGSGRPQTTIDRADEEGRAVQGFNGTPTVTVNGVTVDAFNLSAINAAIDSALLQLGGQPEPTEEAVTPTEEAGATEEVDATEEAAADAPEEVDEAPTEEIPATEES
jgi:protein-disulfide isomerase